MRRFIVALLSVTVMGAVGANAAGLPIKKTPHMAQPAVTSWAGPYVGLTGGYTRGHSNVGDLNGYNGPPPAANFGYNPDGGVAGLYAGYNFQFNWFVTGIEAEAGYLGLDANAQYPPYVGVRGPGDSVAHTNAGWYGEVTGRVGVAIPKFLFFAKGGCVFTDITNSYTDTDPAGTTLVSGTDTCNRRGWTVGGGLEYKITPSWIGRLEYAYYDFGTARNIALTPGGYPWSFDHSLTASVYTVGIAYKF